MDQKRIEAIYDEIASFVIDLEDDPTTLGQRYIQQKVAQCRRYLNSTSTILLEIQREIRNASAKLRAERAAFDIAADNLRACDERVRRLPHVDDRTATINVLLADQRNSILLLEREIEDLKIVEKAVKHRYDELKGTNTDIRTQRTTLRDELDTGAFYGDETDSKPKRRNTLADDELEKIMSGEWTPPAEEPAQPVPQPPAPTKAAPASVPPAKAEETPVAAVHETPAVEVQSAKSDLDDLESLVDNVLASSSVPATEPVEAPKSSQVGSEFDQFMKMDLPKSVPVSLKEAPAGTVSDDDYSDIFASL